MGVFDTLSSISVNISNAYNLLSDKGATIPLNKNIENLASTILTLPLGGGDNFFSETLNKTITEVNDTYSKITQVRNYAFYMCSNISVVNLPLCGYVGGSAFNGCSQITSLFLPSCSYIGYAAFSSAPLSEIDLPEAITINHYAFNGAKTNLKTLSLPKVQRIESYAFTSASITSLYLPECSYIGPAAFESANALTSIDLPMCETLSGVTFILARGAFALCSNLQTASLPLCEILGIGTFRGCSKLSQLVVPNCTKISAQAFSGCRSLSALVLGGSSVVGLANTNAFATSPMSNSTYLGYFGSIYVPASLYNQYITATNWVTYSKRITSTAFNQ